MGRTVFVALALAVGCVPLGCDAGSGWRGDSCAGCNVVLITVDTLRADHTGLAGENGFTPRLARYFADTAVFERASSPAPCTAPAVRQLLTSRFDAAGPHLAETLRRAGYRTAAIASQQVFRWFEQAHRYTSGFDHFDLQAADQVDQWGMTTRSATEVSDHALAWLEQNGNQGPFFLWLYYYDPHDPYQPPAQFRTEVATDLPLADGEVRRRVAETEASWLRVDLVTDSPERKTLRKLYAAEISYVDAEIGRVLDELEALGVAGRSVVALSSDHGERLGEAGAFNHCLSLSEVETHVPLAISLPAETVPGNALRQPVSTLDLYPTLLGIVGVEAPPGLDGRDLRAAPLGKGSPVISAFHQEVALRDSEGRFKLLARRITGSYQPTALFDLARDPEESENLLTREPAIAGRLFRALGPWLEGIEVLERNDREIVERLRALGYAE